MQAITFLIIFEAWLSTYRIGDRRNGWIDLIALQLLPVHSLTGRNKHGPNASINPKVANWKPRQRLPRWLDWKCHSAPTQVRDAMYL